MSDTNSVLSALAAIFRMQGKDCTAHEIEAVIEDIRTLELQVASLTAKLAEARKDWRPIESAPFIEDETGPPILLRGSYIVAGDLSHATTVIGYSSGRKGKFSTNALPFHATHWQPLPPAPRA